MAKFVQEFIDLFKSVVGLFSVIYLGEGDAILKYT